MSDKSKELSTSLNLINERLNFTGTAGGNSPISIDYIPPFGDDLGYTSLELLLLSLSSCLGSAILIFLRRMNKNITLFEINARGKRREEHPTGFEKIILEVRLTSPDITEEDLRKVTAMAEDKYCPVWSMIKGNTEVITEFIIDR
jgi:putative redox protein